MSKLIKPIGQRVLLERTVAEKKTAAGIYIPDTATQEKLNTAVVVRLGTGSNDEKGNPIPFRVNEGDTVILSSYGGTPVEVDSKKYIIINEVDILAVISESAE